MNMHEKKMLAFFRGMDEDDQHAILRYAEFLFCQSGAGRKVLAEPVLAPAAENESVVGALKRLSASYPMLDKAKMLDQTSSLMSAHVMRGQPKEDVISKFENLFDERYQKLKRERKSND